MADGPLQGGLLSKAEGCDVAASLSWSYELTLAGGQLLMRKRKYEVEAEPLAHPYQLRLALECFERKEQLPIWGQGGEGGGVVVPCNKQGKTDL